MTSSKENFTGSVNLCLADANENKNHDLNLPMMHFVTDFVTYGRIQALIGILAAREVDQEGLIYSLGKRPPVPV